MRISEWHQKHREDIPRRKVGRNKGVRRSWLQERREAAEARQKASDRAVELLRQIFEGETFPNTMARTADGWEK